jgi:hypothetical protein
MSLNGEPWPPGSPLQAGCRVSGSGMLVGRVRAAYPFHDVPQMKCTRGVYAAKSLYHPPQDTVLAIRFMMK